MLIKLECLLAITSAKRAQTKTHGISSPALPCQLEVGTVAHRALSIGALGCSAGEKPQPAAAGSVVLMAGGVGWGVPSTGCSLCLSLCLSFVQKQQEQTPPLSQLYCHHPALSLFFPQQSQPTSSSGQLQCPAEVLEPALEIVWGESENARK